MAFSRPFPFYFFFELFGPPGNEKSSQGPAPVGPDRPPHPKSGPTPMALATGAFPGVPLGSRNKHRWHVPRFGAPFFSNKSSPAEDRMCQPIPVSPRPIQWAESPWQSLTSLIFLGAFRGQIAAHRANPLGGPPLHLKVPALGEKCQKRASGGAPAPRAAIGPQAPTVRKKIKNRPRALGPAPFQRGALKPFAPLVALAPSREIFVHRSERVLSGKNHRPLVPGAAL